jgi:ATP-dependent DNA ligase I
VPYVSVALLRVRNAHRPGERLCAGPAAAIRSNIHAVLLRELVDAHAAVRATSARGAKTERLAALLRRLDPAETPAAVAFLSGELTQRQIGVGWAALRDPPAAAPEPSLTVAEVDAAFGRIGALSGPGSQRARREALHELFSRATADEQRFMVALLLGDLGQGALAGVMAEAVARAAEVPKADLRRALMLRGDLGAVAATALADGVAGLRAIGLEVLRPVQPMLAAPGDDLGAALERIAPAAVEYKLDGARIQVHRRGDEVRVFTRTLDDMTARAPEVVEAVLALPADPLVLDGEAIALRGDGRPEPFQVTASRFGTRGPVEMRLTALFFDVLHAGGEDLIDRPGAERFEALAELVPEGARVPRRVASDVAAASAVLDEALARGHEGVMVKSLEAPYAAGRRGAGWLKVKPRHTLDLIVLAAEWGHGRRRGWLSNLHLGARGPGGPVMLGKTFKGLTDAMLTWQTERLLSLEVAREGHVVHVRPELVVEIAFDGVQTSTRYPGGVALRFARVLRHRPDKPAAEADTLEAVLAIHAGAPGVDLRP